MKALQLTKEQRDKLLEMCRKLFPEYPIISMSAGYIMLQTERRPATKKNGNWSCHWFEFCFYHIIPKLNLKVLWTNNIYEDVFIQALHPIDYLYTEFKNKLQ